MTTSSRSCRVSQGSRMIGWRGRSVRGSRTERSVAESQMDRSYSAPRSPNRIAPQVTV